jgi:hypothetical protein
MGLIGTAITAAPTIDLSHHLPLRMLRGTVLGISTHHGPRLLAQALRPRRIMWTLTGGILLATDATGDTHSHNNRPHTAIGGANGVNQRTTSTGNLSRGALGRGMARTL